MKLRDAFSNEWNRLLYPAEGQLREATLELDKTLFMSVFDFLWEDASAPSPITLTIQSAELYVHMAPGRSISGNDVPIINSDTAQSVPELTNVFSVNVTSGLSQMNISNDEMTELVLTIDNTELNPDDWMDFYLLVEYSVTVS